MPYNVQCLIIRILMSDFEAVIGLEIHAQIASKTKMFCRCSNDSFGKEPNCNICPICMGHPGQLPVINQVAVEKGIIAGLALNCKILNWSKFDRKNYFYPDLPKGYQISQFDQPIAQNGFIEIDVNGSTQKIGINRLHLEEDAGKLTHTASSTLCDYNRSGSPLMEIVSEPDLRSSDETIAYATALQKILRYVDASDCDMEKGMMRFDLNVSIRPVGQKEFGTKTEIKNMNSFKALEKALNYELKRQQEVIESGGVVVQETRGWDEVNQVTISQRSKEEAHDYRYFPEPDLPPLEFSDSEIEAFRTHIPELPQARKHRFIETLGLKDADALILSDDKSLGNYFESVLETTEDAQKAASLIISVLIGFMNKDNKSINDIGITSKDLGLLINKVNDGEISHSALKTVLEIMYDTGKNPDTIIEEQNLKQVSDTGELAKMVEKVVQLNEKSVQDYHDGKDRAFGFLVGQVMKETQGKANPGVVNQLLKELLQK